MAQIKIYALRKHVELNRERMSAAIHLCATEALGLPGDKRFHRFFPLDSADFIYPPDRSERYTIIEISMFEGRTTETKKKLINLLFEKLWRECEIAPHDLEITITETPKHNWGIRGVPGDELALNYKVHV